VRQDEQAIFWEICEVVFRRKKGALAMLGMYLDDSKDGLQQVAVVSAGLVGTKIQWEQFWAAWNKRLKQDDIDYFKHKECHNLTGQFKKFRSLGPIPVARSAAEVIKNDLRGVIRSFGLSAFGVAVAMPDWNALRDAPGSRDFFSHPYETAMQSVMFETIKHVRRSHQVIHFWHDDGNDFPRLYEAYLDFKKKNPKIMKHVGGLRPLDDKITPPLQAADLIANEARKLASEWVTTRALPELSKLKACIPVVSVWDKDRLWSLYQYHRKKFFRPVTAFPA
jgi:hypothetical protein